MDKSLSRGLNFAGLLVAAFWLYLIVMRDETTRFVPDKIPGKLWNALQDMGAGFMHAPVSALIMAFWVLSPFALFLFFRNKIIKAAAFAALLALIGKQLYLYGPEPVFEGFAETGAPFLWVFIFHTSCFVLCAWKLGRSVYDRFSTE